MTNHPRHSVSVIGVVPHPDDGRILVIQRADNRQWWPPGGIVEHGETLPTAVRRELAEETGLQVEPQHCTGVYLNTTKHILSIVFLCRYESGEPHTSAEAVAVAWWDVDTVLRHMPPMHAMRVIDALNHTGETAVAVRAHDGTKLLHTLTGAPV